MEPTARRRGSLGPRRVEGSPVVPHERSIRVGVCDDKEAPDLDRLPTLLAREDSGEDADLALEGARRRLDIADARLDLDDDQDPRSWVPADDVRGSTLTEVVERDLDPRQPAERAQLAGHVFHERGVSSVDQSVDIARAPPGIDRERDVKSGADRAKSLKGDMLEPAELDPGDQRLADRGGSRKIQLPPAPTDPDLPDHATDTSIFHARRMSRGPYPGVIWDPEGPGGQESSCIQLTSGIRGRPVRTSLIPVKYSRGG